MASSSRTPTVFFQPSGFKVSGDDGQTVLMLARRSQLSVEQTCNGEGTCGKCRVKVSGNVSSVTADERKWLTNEQLSEGYRLACRVVPEGETEVLVPEVGPLHILSEGLYVQATLRPHIRKEFLEIPFSSLKDTRDDLTRLLGGLGRKNSRISNPALLRSLPGALRDEDGRMTAVLAGNDVIAVEPGDTGETLFGVAFDIGTTTLVGYLRDLNTGISLAVAASINPQTDFGADVIARINHTITAPQGSQELRKAIVRGMNGIVKDLCEAASVAPQRIYEATVAGNTTMLHLLLGLPVGHIAHAPFVPVVRQGLSLSAEELWLKIHPQGKVYLLPHVASYLGADIVADLLATRFASRKQLTLLLDFGTNAEIVLGNQHRILACSAAAGPCFEGGNISCGMRASRGAICGVRLDEGKLHLETIGGAPPAGICGTGLLDLVALLRDHRIMNTAGKLLPPEKNPAAPASLLERIEPGEKGLRFRLAGPEETPEGQSLYLTQRDIRELQAAKAAIAAGIRILCGRFGVEPEQIEEVLLAGAFGNHLRPESGIRLGLLPTGEENACRSIGNAAGVGAQIALLHAPSRRGLERLVSRVEYVELSGIADFTEIYAEEMLFSALGMEEEIL